MENFEMEDPQHAGGEDEVQLNIFERAIAGVKDGLTGVLFVMSKDTRRSKAFSIITMIVDAFQLSALATPTLFTKDLVMHPTLMAIAGVANAFELSQYVGLEETTLTICAVVLVAILLVNVIYVGVAWVRNSFSQVWTVALLRSTAVIMTGVMYIPLVTVMSSSLSCNGDFACQTLRPFNVVLLVFFVLFSLSVTAIFYDARNDRASPVRLPHSRVAVLHQSVRTLLAILAGLLPDMVTKTSMTTVIHFWGGLLTGCSLVLVFAYVWLQPYYSRRVNSLRAMLASFFLWLSVGFLMSDAYATFDPVSTVPTAVFTVGLILTLPMVRLFITWRRSKLLDPCRRHQLSNIFPALDTELKVRLMLEEANKLQRMHATTGGVKKTDAELSDSVMQEAAAIYSEVNARLPDSSQISVLHAQFLLFELKKPLLARRALLLAEARSPALDESFVIYKTKKHLEENAFQSNDIMSFVTSEKHLALSSAYDKKCCMLLVHFWKALGDPKVDVNHIRKLADLIAVASAHAEESYKKLLKLRPHDAPIMETYAGFVETIGNDPEEARKLELRAQDMHQRQVKMTRTADAADDGIDSSSAILTVDASGKPLENGRVMAANTMAGRLFKQPSDFLVNKAVGTVLLPPFTHGFDEMVTKYLEQAEEVFFNKPFETYVRLGMGTDLTLLPCRLVVKPFTADGVEFKMYFSLTEMRASTADVILVDPTTLAIVGVTRGLRSLMSSLAPLDDTMDDTINIEDAIADYGKLVKAWRGEPTFEHELTSKVQRALPGTVKLQVNSVRLHGPTSPALDKITITRAGTHDSTNSEIGSEVEAVNSESEGDSDADADADSGVDSDADADLDGAPLRQARLRSIITAPKQGSASPQSTNRGVCFQEPEDDDDTIEPEVNPLKRQDTRKPAKKPANSGGEAAGSVAGGSSVASGASTSAGIRRAMLASRHKLDAHLFRFRRLFVYTTIISMCMIIAMFAVRSTSLAAHEANDPSQAGLRRLLAVSISYFAHALVLMNKGIVLPCGLDEPAARNQLMELSNELSEISNSLYHRQGTFGDELKVFYEERAIAMREIGSLGTPTIVDRTIFDASMLMSGNAQKASKMPLSEFTAESPEVFLLINNIRHHDHAEPGAPFKQSYLEALNTTTMLYTYQNSAFLPMMNLASAIVAAVVVFVSSIILIIILLPAVNKIDKTKVSVFHELIGMPSQVFGVVSKRYKQRLEMIHGESWDTSGAGDEDGDREEEDEEEEEEDPDAFDEETMLGTLQNTQQNTQPSDTDETRAEKSSSRKKDNNMQSLDKALRANSVRCRVMTRMSGNILVFILYFTVTLYMSFLMEERVEDAPNESNYGGLRSATLRLAIHELRVFATGGLRNGGWEIHEAEMDAEFDHLADIHDALLYGDYNRGLHGILHSRDTNVDQEDLYFTHGCAQYEKPTSRPTANIPPCEEYDHGLVSSGLHRATLKIINAGHFLGHQVAVTIGDVDPAIAAATEDAPAGGGHRLRRMLEVNATDAAAAATAAAGMHDDDHGAAAAAMAATAAAAGMDDAPDTHEEHGTPGEDDANDTHEEHGTVEGDHAIEVDPESHFTPEKLTETLNGPLFLELCELESYYLQPMLKTSIDFYRAQEHRIVNEEEVVQQIALGFLVAFTIGLYFIVVRRLVSNLDNEVKRTRGLLLMIPDDILANLSGLRKFLAKEVNQQ